MDTRDDDSMLGAQVKAVLELFGQELKGVKFPDVDAEIMAEAAAQVRESAAEARRLTEELGAAQERLRAAQDSAAQKAGRALAYARVFGEGNPALAARLEALAPPPRGAAARKARADSVTNVPAPADAAEPRRKKGRAKPSGLLFQEKGAAENEEPVTDAAVV